MTKKQFKEAMMRGLGRCILELDNTEDVEKYREIVLWGCAHNLSYDTQCEGTRAWYLRELIRRFPDEQPFLDVIIQQFSQCRSNGGWDFSYYCELLGLFAQEGNRLAFSALRRKYEELYEILKRKKNCRKNGTFPERDDFETLCIELIDCVAKPLTFYLEIAEDIGTLLLESPVLEPDSFDYLFSYCEQTYGKNRVRKALTKRAQLSPAVNQYFHGILAWNEEKSAERSRTPFPNTTEEILKVFDEERRREQEPGNRILISEFRIGGWIKRSGNTEAGIILAQRYLAEQDSQERVRLLRVFGQNCPFPMSPEPLIQDARSEDKTLSEAAFYALDYVRHEKVRQFALELAEKREHISEAVSLLANHYQEEDRELFVTLVKGIPVTYDDKAGWHGAYMAARNLLETKGVKAPPKELLPYMYEHTLCSFCREYIVKEMGRRHMIKEELLQECLYDSCYEIRVYAERRLRH